MKALVGLSIMFLVAGGAVMLTRWAVLVLDETPEEFMPEIISSQPEVGVIEKIYDLDLPLTFCVVKFDDATPITAILARPAEVGEKVRLQWVHDLRRTINAILATPILEFTQEEGERHKGVVTKVEANFRGSGFDGVFVEGEGIDSQQPALWLYSTPVEIGDEVEVEMHTLRHHFPDGLATMEFYQLMAHPIQDELIITREGHM